MHHPHWRGGGGTQSPRQPAACSGIACRQEEGEPTSRSCRALDPCRNSVMIWDRGVGTARAQELHVNVFSLGLSNATGEQQVYSAIWDMPMLQGVCTSTGCTCPTMSRPPTPQTTFHAGLTPRATDDDTAPQYLPRARTHLTQPPVLDLLGHVVHVLAVGVGLFPHRVRVHEGLRTGGTRQGAEQAAMIRTMMLNNTAA